MTSDEAPPPNAMSVRWSAQRDSILLTGRLLGVAFTLIAAALAFALVFIGVGVKHHGPKYFWDAINPPGVPLLLKFLVIPIELISVFVVRPFSLTIRLFANMLAGHILLVTFIVLSTQTFEKSPLLAVLPAPFAGLVLFTGFELMVAVLQAYVFTILTCIYLNDAIHPGH